MQKVPTRQKLPAQIACHAACTRMANVANKGTFDKCSFGIGFAIEFAATEMHPTNPNATQTGHKPNATMPVAKQPGNAGNGFVGCAYGNAGERTMRVRIRMADGSISYCVANSLQAIWQSLAERGHVGYTVSDATTAEVYTRKEDKVGPLLRKAARCGAEAVYCITRTPDIWDHLGICWAKIAAHAALQAMALQEGMVEYAYA